MKVLDIKANQAGKYNSTNISSSTCNCGACNCNCGGGGCIAKKISVNLDKKVSSIYSLSN